MLDRSGVQLNPDPHSLHMFKVMGPVADIGFGANWIRPGRWNAILNEILDLDLLNLDFMGWVKPNGP